MYTANAQRDFSQENIAEEILLEASSFAHLDDADFQRELSNIVTRRLFGTGAAPSARPALIQALYNRARGLDILQPFVDDPEITEIMVNGPHNIFIEKAGRIQQSEISFTDSKHLSDILGTLFGRLNRPLSLHHPISDARLPDGSRANVVLPPVAPDGPVFTLRKFTGVRHTPEALLESGFLPESALLFLRQQVEKRKDIFICGGTGTGKTTLLNVLSGYISPAERIVTIEDSAELQLVNIPNLVRLEARLAGPDGEGEVSISKLIRAALRMRPDRIIVGEVRGGEATDLIHALNTGHPGSLCTGHGNSCEDMLIRLANLILEASGLPAVAVRQTLATVVDVMVHIRRLPTGERRVDEISTVKKAASGNPLLTPVFRWLEKENLLEEIG